MNAPFNHSGVAALALHYAGRGLPVFPCGPNKKPLTPNGFKDASTDPATVATFWNRNPDALIGVPTGKASGVFALDLDTDRATGEALGEDWLASAGLSHLLNGPGAITPSGGRHIYFRADGLAADLRITAGKAAPGVDTRGNGGYIIAPGSVRPDGEYIANHGGLDALSFPALPDALLTALKTKSRAASGEARNGPVSLAEAEEIIGHIPADSRYGYWLDVLMGLHAQFKGCADALDLAERWSAGGSSYKPGEVAAKWRGFTSDGGISWGTVCHIAREHGADLSEIARRHMGRQTGPTGATSGGIHATNATNGQRKNREKWCADVACTILENADEWRGVLAHDEFTGLDMLLQPIPGTTVPRSTFSPRPMADTDITATVRWFNRNGFPDATKNGTADALFLVARHSIISPVRDFLEGLSWDGVPRVADWLTRYSGAERTDLTSKVGKGWLVSAVARALTPGCKADCPLVLEGRQGAGKSSILRTLAGDDWFHDGLRDMHSKDASAGLRGKWIIELSELSAMGRSDTESIKAFLSRTEERYRPVYGRTEVVDLRRCVFAGTTNRNDYLIDDTGGGASGRSLSARWTSKL